MPAKATQIAVQTAEVPDNDAPVWANEVDWDALMRGLPPDVWYDGRQVFNPRVGALQGLRNRAVATPRDGYLAISDGEPGVALPTFGTDGGGRPCLIMNGQRLGFVPKDIAYHTLAPANDVDSSLDADKGISFGFIGQADSTALSVLWGTLDDSATTNDYLAPVIGFWSGTTSSVLYNARPCWISRSGNTVVATRDVGTHEMQGVPALYLWTWHPDVGKRIYINRTKVVEDTSAGAKTAFTDLRGRLFRMNAAAASLREFKGKMVRFGAWSYAIDQDADYLERWWSLGETLIAP